MSEYLESFIVGVVQGLTEFLPVSSSGHIALLGQLGIGQGDMFSSLMYHVATLLVLMIVYWRDILELIKHPFSEGGKFIIIASIPTAIIAGVVRFLLDDYLDFLLPVGFMLTTVFLFWTATYTNSKINKKIAPIGNTKVAIKCGIMQGIASFAGVSRSGSVLTSLISSGVDRKVVPKYTFLLSIPIILGSTLVEIVTNDQVGDANFGALLVGMLSAFVVGFLAVKACQKLIKSGKIWYFGFYTFLLSIVTLFWI